MSQKDYSSQEFRSEIPLLCWNELLNFFYNPKISPYRANLKILYFSTFSCFPRFFQQVCPWILTRTFNCINVYRIPESHCEYYFLLSWWFFVTYPLIRLTSIPPLRFRTNQENVEKWKTPSFSLEKYLFYLTTKYFYIYKISFRN